MITLHHGDMRNVLADLARTGILFDGCACDPPYHLKSIVDRFGAADAAPAQHGTDGAFARASRGFMGKEWDGGDIAFRPETWRLVYDVLKPGAHLLAFSGTRTYHRMACAIEDAGFEIRDMNLWLYGSGFPKSHDVSKAIDKHLGVKSRVVGTEFLSNDIRGGGLLDAQHGARPGFERNITVAASDQGAAWRGWGTALKPACEPICLARKPLDGTVAHNVLTHGVGGLHIDACRIEGEDAQEGRVSHGGGIPGNATSYELPDGGAPMPAGRWPANVVHDGSPEVLAAFDPYGSRGAASPVRGSEASAASNGKVTGRRGRVPGAFHADAGSASRFFYSAKADSGDRADSDHPTVKPVDLMRWLVRMIIPARGTVLDPFAGSGTTGEAAMLEGMHATLIERETEYADDIRHRINRWSGGDCPLFAA